MLNTKRRVSQGTLYAMLQACGLQHTGLCSALLHGCWVLLPNAIDPWCGKPGLVVLKATPFCLRIKVVENWV
jgi:hypothetical protein